MISFHFGDHRVVLRSVFLNWVLVFNFIVWAQFQVLLLSFLFDTGIGTGLCPFLHADMHANGGLFFYSMLGKNHTERSEKLIFPHY